MWGDKAVPSIPAAYHFDFQSKPEVEEADKRRAMSTGEVKNKSKLYARFNIDSFVVENLADLADSRRQVLRGDVRGEFPAKNDWQ